MTNRLLLPELNSNQQHQQTQQKAQPSSSFGLSKLLVPSSFSLEFLKAPGEETFLPTSDTFTAQNNRDLGEKEGAVTTPSHEGERRLSRMVPAGKLFSTIMSQTKFDSRMSRGLANTDNALKIRKE